MESESEKVFELIAEGGIQVVCEVFPDKAGTTLKTIV